jgi:hypothetical protein
MTGHLSNTVTDYIRFFRELVISILEDEDQVISKENIIVEINESKFGKRKYNRGHMIEGVWVIGGIERTEERKCFIKVI